MLKSVFRKMPSASRTPYVGGDGANMVLSEKSTKNWKLRGLKLRGLRQSQISTPYFIYQNDHRNKINIFGDFENEITKHMGAAHAISKIEQNFQNRTPRELNQSFDIPRISVIH